MESMGIQFIYTHNHARVGRILEYDTHTNIPNIMFTILTVWEHNTICRIETIRPTRYIIH